MNKITHRFQLTIFWSLIFLLNVADVKVKDTILNKYGNCVITSTYLRKPAADSLGLIQKKINDWGLKLKVFDAYLPYSVTEKMWKPVKDGCYTTDSKKDSGHNHGITVDLTIFNSQTGEELNMCTDLDNFSDTGQHALTNLAEDVLKYRLL